MFGEFPLPTAAGVEAVAKGLRGRRHARGDRADDGRPQLLRGDPRPRRRAARAACASQALKIKYAHHAAEPRRVPADAEGLEVRPRLHPAGARADDPASLLRRVPRRLPRPRARSSTSGIQMHVAESKMQAVVGAEEVRQDARRAPRFARRCSAPSSAPRTAVWLDDDDRARLADRGASMSHNPGSNMKLGSGMADARAHARPRRERRDRHRRRRLLRQPQRLRGDAAGVVRLARRRPRARALAVAAARRCMR